MRGGMEMGFRWSNSGFQNKVRQLMKISKT